MKYTFPLLLLVFSLSVSSLKAQEREADEYASYVSSLDGTLETLYAVISGEKGEARAWDLFRYLFHADAKLIPTRKDTEGRDSAKYMSVEEYIESSGRYLVENGFFEKEIHRTTESFGPITHVFSTYESYHSRKDDEPFARGINSIQLLNDGERWWVVNIYWSAESPSLSIPKEYLPGNE
ncbi:hypothetical protein E7Z59_02240 [Robertkochia marina]|uniref:Nuclear transport factor 2 family protein n=1 Tax=Robertkochia marina TaxID=1227945 RepID=A0A4S3M4D6_9FLAO|nr:hypothetical protein [Robertkochia marina]THD69171.1 hypothetical protein E7Z59_02240 [Robertkochia marina]TRZ47571.1 hypothetical protein D3A96_02360 [Robertkochia marina]